MIHRFFLDKRPRNGLTYKEYFDNLRLLAEGRAENQTDNTKESPERYKLNYRRSSRIQKTFSVDHRLCEAVKNISEKQLWMIISEYWCGDSAQNIPYIVKIAECNPLITLRIILRDANPDIMNYYLTDGVLRSIPKLVAFDEYGDELFQWGPRPKEAQELVNNLKKEGKSKDEFLEQLHLWYGKNRGKNLENEFKIIFKVENNSN